MKLLKKIIACYWDVCLIKASPESTPYSIFLFTLSGLLLALIMTMQWSLSSIDFFSDLLLDFAVAVSIVISFISYTAIILFFKKMTGRLVQTSTCLFCTQSMVHCCALPLFALDPYLTPDNLKNPIFLFLAVIYLFITLGLSIWQFIITVHIYKHALNANPMQSVLAAFGLVAVNVLTLSFWR